MDNIKKKSWIRVLLSATPFLFFAGISIYFYLYSSPEQLVELVGAENSFFLIFVLALLGGLTTFSGVPYHLVLITLAIGGLSPLFLGISTAVGVILGDTTSYFVGYSGGEVMPSRVQKIVDRVYIYTDGYPKLLQVFFFLFGALTPISNDFIVISAGIAKYPFWKVMIPLAFGNLIFNITLSYFAISAYGLLQGVLL